ncbi:MAG TPA: M24 family metallopeptidase [Acidimicrobiales bacterium]|nr:M24 family metallopeptidase [Acidimicrobiales bacterium]
MQRDRRAKLKDAMDAQGVDALVLLGNSNVSYATGASWPLADPGRANFDRPVAVVAADDEHPHLFTAFADLVAPDLSLPEDHLHRPAYLEFDEGAEAFCRDLAEIVGNDARVAIDELPGSMRRVNSSFFSEAGIASADEVVGAAKLVKTSDELGFLRTGLLITEKAIAPVQAALAPGVREVDLTACFLRGVFDLGAEANILDPIFQVMPRRLADGPWTTHGDIACPLPTTERELELDDVLWVDTGISYVGFASDFGRTWIVGSQPTVRQHAQFRAWREIIGAVLEVTCPGATGADLTRAALAASDGRKPWMEHFYLAHGLGIESAEPPFIGTDLGEGYDERQVLVPGMVVVLEPLVWDDGAAGYRSEEVVVITEDGWASLTDYPYDPYAD